MNTQGSKAKAFKALHHLDRGFLMPNAWDAGSAVVLASEKIHAIGTTSAGIAFSLGKPDFDVRDQHAVLKRKEMFSRIKQIVEAVALPVNGDLEDGYGSIPKRVADTVSLAIEAGLAGGNIEDNNPREDGLYNEELSVDRIRAAREMIDARGGNFVLNAKTDAFLVSVKGALATSIRRANLYLEAGADCVYPCGSHTIATIKTLVREINGPVNIVTGWGSIPLNVFELLDIGVKRVSVGGSLARATLGLIRQSTREMCRTGTTNFAAKQMSQNELNSLFRK
ncbi:isocitrate lyase/PEP mutase family protein [Phyllobacterium myrsinacearum]|uniref:2-methylisocitrate lyase-like PEP mutase family enzyme n=1 Tax=Phyllobacterium myrsinacearum TaxID=28101 RepID=A0A839EYL7_9HYPH|nr:isocitrate lyase/phosphoenolpyruvate mutase family protein [Phyllobacterium myrsinacearum]MBA8881487.1 2-methylisocitrate lyase-like PEP mutase family enzyme [Phyllobacterium myrsinacearum]